MSKTYIVVDDQQDWEPYYPSENLLTLKEYFALEIPGLQRIRVINLCEDYGYLREGYYCSLLAEARGHHVIPTINVLNDISQPLLYQLQVNEVTDGLGKLLKSRNPQEEIYVKSYFGLVSNPAFKQLARLLFERLPCPVLNFTLRHTGKWEISAIDTVNHRDLTDAEQTEFADALDHFSRKVWREPRRHKPARYDLAILVNPDEALPPSDKTAIKKFIKAGKFLGVDVELITPNDFIRLPEFDALFIRETTAIDHHTYRFAKKAESEGMVVIDDPISIMRCTNKIYLAKLFETHKVPTPRTLIIQKNEPDSLTRAAEQLGLPLILKIPDGSFSRGVVKVDSLEQMREQTDILFQQSSLLLAQEYLYTEFDWRIGMLDNKPLYACRYYMVRHHWQIYRHDGNNSTKSGGFDTLPTFEVPRHIIQAAAKATKPIGNGFYGVDIKEVNGQGYVIEVNDNPSIDSGVEDKFLGNSLYTQIIQNIIERIEDLRQTRYVSRF